MSDSSAYLSSDSSDDELRVLTTSRSAFQTYRPGVTKRKRDGECSTAQMAKRLKRERKRAVHTAPRPEELVIPTENRRSPICNHGFIQDPDTSGDESGPVASGSGINRISTDESDDDEEEVEEEEEEDEDDDDDDEDVDGVEMDDEEEEDEDGDIIGIEAPLPLHPLLNMAGAVHIHVDAFHHHRPANLSEPHLELWVRQHLELEQRRSRNTPLANRFAENFMFGVPENMESYHPLNSILRRFLNYVPRDFPQEELNAGASSELIQNTTLLFNLENREQINNDQNSCVVCIMQFELGQSIRQLRCAHVFHQSCVDRWLGNKKCCPICRTSIDESAST